MRPPRGGEDKGGSNEDDIIVVGMEVSTIGEEDIAEDV